METNCRIGRVTFKPGFQPGAQASHGAAGGTLLPAYDAGAGTGRRQSAWLTTSSGVNTTVIAHAATLRNRARHEIRTNPWARQIKNRYVANAIGTGIRPQSRHPDEAVRETLHEKWRDWTEESDPEGVGDYYEQQALCVGGGFESGEVFVRLRPRSLAINPGDGPEVPLQVQVLEADHVPLAENRIGENGNIVIAGIEFDRQGRRRAYYMYREHPGEFLSQRPRGWELERVPAAEILHLFVRERPGQVRGAPRLASVLARLHALDEYEDAELLRKKIAAMFAAFIIPGVGEDGAPLVEEKPDSKGEVEITLEPGMSQVLPAGADIKFAEPAEVGTSYDPFMKWNLHGVAAGADLTYEQVTGDLSDVNFTSLRAGLLENRRGFEQFQANTPVYQLNRPVWRLWLDQAALAGVTAASDYLANRRDYRRVKWVPQGWPWVDPEKEQKASLREVRAGFGSRSRVVAARGDDVEEIDREIAEDKARADNLGLTLDSDPSRVNLTGATQAKPAGSALPDPAEEAGAVQPPAGGGDEDKEKKGEEDDE
jgi:lambda family phage portal protein